MGFSRFLTMGGLGAVASAAGFDFVIDAIAGDDSAAGTALAPWASLNKIENISGSTGARTRVLVRTGLYDKATDFFEVVSQPTGSTLEVYFEPGCTMDGTVANATAAQNPIYAGNSGSWTMEVVGNGLHVQHYNNGTDGSPNGLGYGGAGVTLIARDVVVADTYDGISGHALGHGEFHNVTIRSSIKTAVANVGGSTMDAYGCTFEEDGGESGGFFNSSTGRQYFEGCRFIPVSGTSKGIIRGDEQVFVGCTLGTLTDKVQIQEDTVAASITVTDCFIHQTDPGQSGVIYTRCFGFLTIRLRDTGGATVENCVIIGVATGETRFLNSNYDPGDFGPYIIRNTIFKGAFTFDGGMNATKEAYCDEIVIRNNILHGGAAISESLGTNSNATVSANLSDDPLIGAADSYDPARYGFGSGSPAIGAGVAGVDIGFSDTDLAAVGSREPATAADYFIDSILGDDTNTGQSRAAPWATLAKIDDIPKTDGVSARVHVRAGAYAAAGDFVDITTFGAGATLTIDFEAGATMDGTASNASTGEHAISAGPSGTWAMEVLGHGLRISGYANATDKPNNLTVGGSGVTMIARDIWVDGGYGGVFGYDSGHMSLYNVSVCDCLKSAISFISDGTLDARGCVFVESGSESSGFTNSTTGALFYSGCRFIPHASGNGKLKGDDQRFVQCQLGSVGLEVRIERNSVSTRAEVTDCYINVYDYGLLGSIYSRCFGKLSIRLRDTGGATVENCVITGAATGETKFLNSNYDPGSFAAYVIKNSIFEGSFAWDSGISGTKETYCADCEIVNNILFGGAAISVNLGTNSNATVSGNLSDDPVIGSGDTLNPNDFGFGPGSPAIGGASPAGDIGFPIGALAPPGVA